MGQEQVGVGFHGDIRRQGQVAHMNALVDLEVADIHLDRLGNGARLARDLERMDQVFEDPAGRDARRHAAHLERDLGFDHFLGAHPGEIEVEDLLAEVIPLHVADQDSLGGTTHVQVGQAAWRLDHPPDVVPGQGDRHDRLLMPVDHAGNQPLAAQPPRHPGARSLVLFRVTRLDTESLLRPTSNTRD